jgi:serpin B
MKPLLLALVPLLFFEEVAGMSQTLPVPTPPAPSPDQAAVVQGNNAFAVDLYGHLRAEGGNLFFSPESISTAFAMAFAGARGDTATEMASAFHFTLPPDRLHPAMGALLAGMNAAHPSYELHVADALWAEKNFAFLDDFLKLTSTHYGAGFNRVDFEGSPEAARKTINQWVEQKTEDKIQDLIPPGGVGPATRLVLTNAIYFKGSWESPFDKAQTRDEDFHLSVAQTVKAPLMHITQKLGYCDGGTFKAIDIPYKSRELSMIVLLPNDVAGLPALEQSLTAAGLKQWLDKLQVGPRVVLTLPKFRMSQRFELEGTLARMGMAQAFQAKSADFSAMTGKRDFWISAAIHKAYVDVNEEGTEAAAATGIMVGAMAVARPQPPIVFRADHPFLFLIRDNRSGAILFMGRVADPTK